MGQELGMIIIKSFWWKSWVRSNVQEMVLKSGCQRQTGFWMGESTLIILDELMTLLVQRLNEWIML